MFAFQELTLGFVSARGGRQAHRRRAGLFRLSAGSRSVPSGSRDRLRVWLCAIENNQLRAPRDEIAGPARTKTLGRRERGT